jgi:hypothetical protein
MDEFAYKILDGAEALLPQIKDKKLSELTDYQRDPVSLPKLFRRNYGN